MKPPLLWHQDELFQALTTTLGVTQLKQIMEGNRTLITFANGYGVMIMPVGLKKRAEVFD